MAGKATDLSVSLDRWQQIAATLKAGKSVNMRELADILGMTDRNLRSRYVQRFPDFPTEAVGGPGKDYRFDAKKVLVWLIAKTKQKIAEEGRRNAQLAAMTGIDIGAPVPAEVSSPAVGAPDYGELRRQLELTALIRKERVLSGEYVPRDAVRTFVDRYHGVIRDSLLGSMTQIDPAGALPADIRALVDERFRHALTEIEIAASRFLGDADTLAR